MFLRFFFFKQKTAYEMRISDWSSDVCSSDLADTIGTIVLAPVAVVIITLVASVIVVVVVVAVAVAISIMIAIGKAVTEIRITVIAVTAEAAVGICGTKSGMIVGRLKRPVIRAVAIGLIVRIRREVIGEAVRTEEHTHELQSLMRT